MSTNLPDRPKLRAIEAIPIEEGDSPQIILRDPSGESEDTLVVSEAALWILSRLDGSRDLGDLQAEICRSSGEIVPRSTLEDLVGRLESVGFLDSPAFREHQMRSAREYAAAQSRPAAFAGKSYPADGEQLGEWIDRLIESGKPSEPSEPRGLVAPHIDPARGGRVYGSAYRAIRQATQRRILILGISHSGGAIPYAITTKDFATPLGTFRTDTPFIEELCRDLPFDPLGEEILHRKEHSIEFQTLFLRRALEERADRVIVPLLCCFPYVPPGREEAGGDLARWREEFSGRLASLVDEDTLVVAGVDFAHVGRRFGDPGGPVDDRVRAIEAEDREMMQRIAEGDLAGFRAGFDATQDQRRVCGYPALVTLLEILQGARGEALDYDQAIDRSVDSLVSFGAILLH